MFVPIPLLQSVLIPVEFSSRLGLAIGLLFLSHVFIVRFTDVFAYQPELCVVGTANMVRYYRRGYRESCGISRVFDVTIRFDWGGYFKYRQAV
jgi:hypothetical protein